MTQTLMGKFRLLLHLFHPPPSRCFIHSCLLAAGVSFVMHWQDVSCLLTFYGKLTHHQPLERHMRLLPAALSLCPATSLQFPFPCSDRLSGYVDAFSPMLRLAEGGSAGERGEQVLAQTLPFTQSNDKHSARDTLSTPRVTGVGATVGGPLCSLWLHMAVACGVSRGRGVLAPKFVDFL